MSRDMTGAAARAQARLAGFLYLIVVLTSVYALITTSGLIVRNDAAATAANVVAQEQTFRLAFVANLLACAAYIAVVALLYDVLRPAGKTLAIVAAFFGLAGCAVSGASMINHIGALMFLGDASYLAAFQPEQLQGLSRRWLRLSTLGNSVSLVFFGCYCLCRGMLVFRASFLPRVLGLALLVAGLGWLIGNVVSFVAPSLGLSTYLIPVSGIGELLFTLWLLAMGVNAAKWEAQAAEGPAA